ncbi:MAG: hypothetical protein HGA85_02725 [Nanoarchaeota archaeon]|nr:hypothetical protein [Nanoarchaeota archaeon]
MFQKIAYFWDFLKNPKTGLSKLETKSLDTILGNYLTVLLLSSIVAGLSTFILGISKSAYYHYVLKAKVDIAAAVNYSAGISISLFFFYLFLGTVIVFILSILLGMILRKPLVYCLRLLMLSMSPFLLFGWLPLVGYSLVIWVLYLVAIGINK